MSDPTAERDSRIAAMAIHFCNAHPPIVRDQEKLFKRMFAAYTDGDLKELMDVENKWDSAANQTERAALAARVNAVAIRVRNGEGVLSEEIRPEIQADGVSADVAGDFQTLLSMMIQKNLKGPSQSTGAPMGELVNELLNALRNNTMPDFRKVEPRPGRPNQNPVYSAAIQSCRLAGTLPITDSEFKGLVNAWNPKIFEAPELLNARRDLAGLLTHNMPVTSQQGGSQQASANTFNVDWLMMAVRATKGKVRNVEEALRVLKIVSEYSVQRPLSKTVWERTVRRSALLGKVNAGLVIGSLGIYACTASVNLSRLVGAACAVYAGGHPVVGVLNRLCDVSDIAVLTVNIFREQGRRIDQDENSTSPAEHLLHQLLIGANSGHVMHNRTGLKGNALAKVRVVFPSSEGGAGGSVSDGSSA